MKANKVWDYLLFPLRERDRVRYCRNLGHHRSVNSKKVFGKVGIIISIGIEKSWKEAMVYKSKCYPSAILKEEMIKVHFPIPEMKGINFALRKNEVERVIEGEE